MPLYLKVKEICLASNRCKHKGNSNGVGVCMGCDPNRNSDFTCNYFDEILKSENTPYSPDKTIRGKEILHG